MTQHTAVEWLWRWQMDNEFASFKEGVDAYKKAKAMEKEQIIQAHLFGLLRPIEMEATKQAEQYYNETYNK
jgi:hypothetical protein